MKPPEPQDNLELNPRERTAGFERDDGFSTPEPLDLDETIYPLRRGARKWPWKWLLIGLAMALLAGWLAYTNRTAGDASEARSGNGAGAVSNLVQNTGQNTNRIVVDVHGDVVRPGVYDLPVTARVQDAIRAAGGYLHPADAQFVNAAAPLDDGQEVIVPDATQASASRSMGSAPAQKAEPPSSAKSGTSGPANASAQLDLNTADTTSLEALPGIGPTRASAIIQYRIQHGGFRTPSELQNVPGIGDKTWQKIQPYVTVGLAQDGQKP